MKPISKAVQSIAPSATLAIDSLAKSMKAEGIDVIGFGAGEPDFATPDAIKQAAIDAINANKTRYTPATGTVALKKAIADDLKARYDLDYEPSQICVSSGAKHNIFVTLQAIIDPGDEVVLPAPYWVSYYEAIRMAGGVPVIVETTEEAGFKMTAEQFEAAVTEKTKCLILTNPSNPTGMVYSKEELMAVADVVLRHDLYVISDEIYCQLVYTGQFYSFASLSPEMKERTILINGVSKTYAMTGWRIGYSASNAQIAKAMSNYLSHSTGNPCSVSQEAAIAALTMPQEPVEMMKAAFDERR
ncbi:MAG: pyridoxal phosphate-dependent aminotransferase, partial [Oscillospiraceae bacterium]|nr:pyridoxal phosphate-dependent aminotransferase [Oscillospiraceae bacterium]